MIQRVQRGGWHRPVAAGSTRLLWAGLVLGFLTAPSVPADPLDLSGGVFIAHHPPGLAFEPRPPHDYCAEYDSEGYGIDSLAQQNNRIDVADRPMVWYVVCAWGESKEWCGVGFGLGDYDASAFFTSGAACGPCWPDGLRGVEIPTDGWPGPGEGVALAVAPDHPWNGNFVPIYYFIGAAKAEGVIPLSYNPKTGFGGWGSCGRQPQLFRTAGYGAMGLLTDGVFAVPESPPSGTADSTGQTSPSPLPQEGR